MRDGVEVGFQAGIEELRKLTRAVFFWSSMTKFFKIKQALITSQPLLC